MIAHSRILESVASRALSDPAEHEGGELIELRDSSDHRFLARVTTVKDSQRLEVLVLGAIIPDPVEVPE